MRFYTICSLLFSLCVFLIFSGCGDRVEDSDASALGYSEDFRFQDIPIAEGGSLILPDEIPVITIEKTREDAEAVWWRLKTDPTPQREDLVVGVEINRGDIDSDEWRRLFDWFIDQGHFAGRFVPFSVKRYMLYIAIPKFENSSVEMKAPTIESIGWIENNRYSLQIATPEDMILTIIGEWDVFLRESWGIPGAEKGRFAPVDLPPMLLSDGYVIPQEFQFSYYHRGSGLEISKQE